MGLSLPYIQSAITSPTPLPSTLVSLFFRAAVWGLSADYTVSDTQSVINISRGSFNPPLAQSFAIGDRIILSAVSTAQLKTADVTLQVQNVGNNQLTVSRVSGAAAGTVFTITEGEVTGQTRLTMPAAPTGTKIDYADVYLSAPSAVAIAAADSSAIATSYASFIIGGSTPYAYYTVKTDGQQDIDFEARYGVPLREGARFRVSAQDISKVRIVSATTKAFSPVFEIHYQGTAGSGETIPTNPVDPNPVDPNPVDPNPVDPNPVDPVDPDPNPVDPDPVDPNPVDPVDPDPDPVDPNAQKADIEFLGRESTFVPADSVIDQSKAEVTLASSDFKAQSGAQTQDTFSPTVTAISSLSASYDSDFSADIPIDYVVRFEDIANVSRTSLLSGIDLVTGDGTRRSLALVSTDPATSNAPVIKATFDLKILTTDTAGTWRTELNSIVSDAVGNRVAPKTLSTFNVVFTA